MKYLIFDTKLAALERNHAEACRRTWDKWEPLTDRDTPYWWAMTTHPTTGEVALSIPDEETTEEALQNRVIPEPPRKPSWKGR